MNVKVRAEFDQHPLPLLFGNGPHKFVGMTVEKL